MCIYEYIFETNRMTLKLYKNNYNITIDFTASFHMSFGGVQLRNPSVSLERFRQADDGSVRAVCRCSGCRLL
jgi:hypothetical protein